jgi:hypothetical protein
MIVIIQETVWANNQWLVVASVDAGTGTMVGPYLLDLPEDATNEEMIAAIEAIVGA